MVDRVGDFWIRRNASNGAAYMLGRLTQRKMWLDRHSWISLGYVVAFLSLPDTVSRHES